MMNPSLRAQATIARGKLLDTAARGRMVSRLYADPKHLGRPCDTCTEDVPDGHVHFAIHIETMRSGIPVILAENWGCAACAENDFLRGDADLDINPDE